MADSIELSQQEAAAPQVLVVSDRPDAAAFYADSASRTGLDSARIASGDDALASLRRDAPRVAILDLTLSGAGGLELLRAAQAEKIETRFVAVASGGSLRLAVDAMKQGAFDYLAEPFDGARLGGVLRSALGQASADGSEQDSAGKPSRPALQRLAGASPAVREICAAIETAAASGAPVMITGEGGIGKDVCAFAVHAAGQRRSQPLVTINCAAIPPDSLETEMFGHVRGVFAGAVSDRTGAVTEAHGGALFIDEVCDLPPSIQANLLRLIETGRFQRQGAAGQERADLRIICATSRDAQEEVRAGRFSQDLLGRLQGVSIHLRPLRERGGDIAQIASYFLKDAASWETGQLSGAADAEDAPLSVQRPGDARELQTALYQAVASAGEAGLGFSGAAPEQPATGTPASSPAKTARDIKPLWLVEQEAIEEAVAICGQNIPKAAAYLEVSVATVHRKLAEYQAARKQAG